MATSDLQKTMPSIGLGCANVMKAGLIELIETAARHGFTRISARPYAFAEALEQGHTEKSLRQRLKDAGIKVMLIDGLNRGLPGVPSPDTIDPALRAVYPPDVFNPPSEDICFRAAEYLEAGVVNLIHHRGSPDLPQADLAEAVGKICARAKSRGLRVALEFVPNTGFGSLPIAQAIAEACGQPNCGIVLDFFHLDRSGGTVEDIRRLPPNAIDNIQISDRTPLPPGTAYKPMSGRQMPGDGKLPLRDLMAAALANSPNASADIEVLNDELRDMSTDAATARLAAVAKSWRASL